MRIFILTFAIMKKVYEPLNMIMKCVVELKYTLLGII